MHRVSTVRVLTHHNRNTNCRKLLCTALMLLLWPIMRASSISFKILPWSNLLDTGCPEVRTEQPPRRTCPLHWPIWPGNPQQDPPRVLCTLEQVHGSHWHWELKPWCILVKFTIFWSNHKIRDDFCTVVLQLESGCSLLICYRATHIICWLLLLDIYH